MNEFMKTDQKCNEEDILIYINNLNHLFKKTTITNGFDAQNSEIRF